MYRIRYHGFFDPEIKNSPFKGKYFISMKYMGHIMYLKNTALCFFKNSNLSSEKLKYITDFRGKYCVIQFSGFIFCYFGKVAF